MKFIIFNGTLKRKQPKRVLGKIIRLAIRKFQRVLSTLLQFARCCNLQLAFKKIGDECEIVTMRDLKYDAATKDVDDELKPYIMDIFKSDGIVFATPIWWGGHSSHIQSMFQRLDPIYSWGKDNKFQPFYNKVFGTLVSGGGDGFQHIHGNCYNFATNLGFTIPPSCNIESKAQGMDEIVKDEQTLEQVKNCAINMSTWARSFKRR